MNTRFVRLALASVILLALSPLTAQVPQIINFQGRVSVQNIPYQGLGQFKFALVNTDGTVTFWSNDGTSASGSEPVAAVGIVVDSGLYNVKLGDASLPHMLPISPTVFTNSDVRLRVWFDDGRNGSQQLTPDQRITSVGYAMMAANVPNGAITSASLAPGSVGPGQLANGAALANLLAGSQSPVPAGGAILSFHADLPSLTSAGYVNVGALSSVPERWETRSTQPSPRQNHAAIWTGTEMIVWGGGDQGVFLNTGGRYNPTTDTWRPTSTTNAPTGRWDHGMFWIGAEMLVWGGSRTFFPGVSNLGDGGRYDPNSDSWKPIANAGAPSPRKLFATVWTGTEMLVWGGLGNGYVTLGDGARYNPVTDAWAPITTNGAPSARSSASAVWTGSEMIVWSGEVFVPGANVVTRMLADGARYNPTSDSWTSIATNGAPSGASYNQAVWTGREMIVWGGADEVKHITLDTGGRYDPVADSWKPVSQTNAPSTRAEHVGVWTGDDFVVWGGDSSTNGVSAVWNSGGRYSPATDSWVALSPTNAPSPRANPTAVWTGSAILIFGGFNRITGLNSTHAWFPTKTLYVYERR